MMNNTEQHETYFEEDVEEKNESGGKSKSFFARMKIRTKLITIISTIIFVSLAGMIFLATFFFRKDNTVRIEESNHKIAEITSLKMRTDFNAIVEKLNIMGTTMLQQFRSNAQKTLFTDLFFRNDKNLIYVGIAQIAPGGKNLIFKKYMHNISYFNENQFTLNDIAIINAETMEFYKKSFNNEAVVQNVSSSFKSPVIAMALPFQRSIDNRVVSIVVGYMKMDKFLQAFKTAGITKTFMVNNQGDVIAHPDSKIVMSHANFVDLPIVDKMLKSNRDNELSRYKDETGEYFIGAFNKIGIAGLGVIATVNEDKAFEAVYRIQRRNIYITIIVLTLAILIVYFFSKTITTPIIRLLGATQEIEKGNFRVDILATSGDEIGELTNSFISMGQGLEEREKMKDAFGKFVNKEIAEQVLKGEIQLGGERKIATVFFSDIRAFTAISEKLEPEEVVEFLNQYMTRMVNCVNDTSGVVDKYIGDAIMAIWGVPVSHGNDTENAINGTLMMRKELIDFNKGRGGEKKPIIKIGCGLNTGPVLAGQIGSEDRMEYTVIGDTVNLASRIEALNKPFGTDILITQDTYDIVKDIFRTEPMQKIKVKGKIEPQQIYAVLGRKDDPLSPKTVDELRALVGIVLKVPKEGDEDLEEEVKYEIIE